MSPEDYHPVLQGFVGTLFTWGMTAAGAALVFFTTTVNQKVMDLFFGFAAGVMISASCFGLIGPSVAIAEEQAWSKNIAWLPAVVGFLIGSAFLKIVSLVFAHHHGPQELEEVGMKEKPLKELEEQHSISTMDKKLEDQQDQEKKTEDDRVLIDNVSDSDSRSSERKLLEPPDRCLSLAERNYSVN